MELPERKIYTVSELTEEIKDLLEGEFGSIWVQGEISNTRLAPSGHFYLVLKDDAAQIRCVMFKPQSRFLKFRPEDGLHVAAWGRVSVYTPRGEYQLILDTMEPLGLGSLMLAFEQLRNKLAAEGLFDEGRKRHLPRFPKTVGLVTSKRGAVVRDMARIAGRRSPSLHILLSPASVQGERAPEELIAALDRLCAAGDVDVIIIGRGGGSIEDLWAFNDERVVRAVAQCPVPIVSAVGHETDFTLTDFAADVRASTPSAAAEIVVPDRLEVQDRVLHLTTRLRNRMLFSLDRWARTVQETMKRLYDPRRKIQDRRQWLDDVSARLTNAVKRKLRASKNEVLGLCARARPEIMSRKIATGRQELDYLLRNLDRSMRDSMAQSRASAERLVSGLNNLSPLAVLARGYSITVRPDTGAVVKEARSIPVGEELKVVLHKGEIDCAVTGTRDSEPRSIRFEKARPDENGVGMRSPAKDETEGGHG
ncbi:MAG: exodeoxyribonuclease VII large subunit [Deltaproteobacteria bacterium]|nr:exodeoxyribonuclease VII large subunit [Deltaproteobacteria bacterium]